MKALKKLLDWLSSLFEPSPPKYHPTQPFQKLENPEDIRTYPSTKDVLRSGRFTREERAAEYRRRGKGPAGVIDGVYNDEFLEDGVYNDEDRDWDADA